MNKYFCGKKINAKKLRKNLSITELVENYYQAYNSARLQEASRLLVEKMLDSKRDATIGLTLAGALTPAGMSGMIVSMMEAGFIDFIISTGANLYHDMHFALGYDLKKGIFDVDDAALWKHKVVRIYDTFLTTDTLLNTDKYSQKILLNKKAPRGAIASSELHYYYGRCLLKDSPHPEISVLAQAAKLNIPIYTSSPGDSTMGMDLAVYNKAFNKKFQKKDKIDLMINSNRDVIETAAIIMAAKENGAVLLGGGSPKNFYMQTQPFLWECMGITKKRGHDYFIQVTMDSPSWGGLSGATPSEAVSWGKIKPDEIKNTVVVYSDVTLAIPILFSYALTKAKKRKQKNLYQKLDKLVYELEKEGSKMPTTWLPDYKRS